MNLKLVIDRMREVGLDAEGSDYYLDSIDMIPAINSAVEWIVGILSTRLGKDKFVEERLSDLHMIKIWQTNLFSRVSLAETLGFRVLGITGVIAKPRVYVSLNSTTNLPTKYRQEILPYVNQEHENAPIVTVPFNSSSMLKDSDSTYRPELVFRSGKLQAAKMTHDQMGEALLNPFSSGYAREGDFVQYGYIPFIDTSNYNPDSTKIEGQYLNEVPKEITIMPDLRRGLVAISFIRVPEEIPKDTNTATYDIPLPASLTNILVQKSLNYIAMKQGDQTTIFSVSIQEVLQQLQ